MATPPTQVGIRLGFDMYRHGGTARVHNVFHFNGPAWTNQAEFETVADALTTAYKAALSAAATIKECVAYNPNSWLPVYSKTYNLAGLLADAGNNKLCPSDCAMVLRFGTTQRTTKNHPIYLFKYMKPAMCNQNTSVEQVGPPSKTALETFGSALVSGFNDGTRTRIYCGPRGAVAQNRTVDDYIGHRDFVS